MDPIIRPPRPGRYDRAAAGARQGDTMHRQMRCPSDTTTVFRSDRFTPDEWSLIDAFHRLWYEKRAVGAPMWCGLPILKTPGDLFSYQEILMMTQPDWIVETGTAWGGSTLFLASICDLLGHGQICSVDVTTDLPALYRWAFTNCDTPILDHRPVHPRILYLTGNVLDPTCVAQVRALIRGRVMVTLDSHHDAEHVTQELAFFAPLVTPGCYLVLEDTNMGGHPVQDEPYNGPYEALLPFLDAHPEFAVDLHRGERWLWSYNTWMRRLSPEEMAQCEHENLARPQEGTHG
jgi:cephalosporin hydroxylase